MLGTITDVIDSGSIVKTLVVPLGGGVPEPIYWDWRMFKNFLDDYGGDVERLKGMRVKVERGVVMPLEPPQSF